MALTTCPHTACEHQGCFARTDWLAEGRDHVVHPKVAGEGCRTVGGVIAMISVTTASGTFAICLIKPIGRHTLVEVAGLQELPPDELSAGRDGCIPCQTTQSRVGQASLLQEHIILT